HAERAAERLATDRARAEPLTAGGGDAAVGHRHRGALGGLRPVTDGDVGDLQVTGGQSLREVDLGLGLCGNLRHEHDPTRRIGLSCPPVAVRYAPTADGTPPAPAASAPPNRPSRSRSGPAPPGARTATAASTSSRSRPRSGP